MDVLTIKKLIDRLFPIVRSITGDGFRQSLAIISDYLPLETKSIPSGEQVFDWTIPREWVIRSAFLKDETGRIVCSLEQSSLSVISYSEPVDQWLALDELKPHLHFIENLPDAIPYVTSYYKPGWGFCLPYNVYKKLPEGRYHAFIDSEFIDGELNYAELTLLGNSDNLVLLSSYLCHPSLANNELSGPIVLALVYQLLQKRTDRYFSYRFLINPETIGSIAYLSREGESLKNNMAAGMVLTCLGGPSDCLSYKKTRQNCSLIDKTIEHLRCTGVIPLTIREFTPVDGSDERQYCSPGFNLPMGQIARTVYGQYDGYHNSLDTPEFMGIEPLIKSADDICSILHALEYAGKFINLSPYCEPQLGRRNLYPNVNSSNHWKDSSDVHLKDRTFLNSLLMILNYSDGENDMVDIADRCEVSLLELIPVIDKLIENKLLKRA
jgi:aminopeptidase-like protein